MRWSLLGVARPSGGHVGCVITLNVRSRALASSITYFTTEFNLIVHCICIYKDGALRGNRGIFKERVRHFTDRLFCVHNWHEINQLNGTDSNNHIIFTFCFTRSITFPGYTHFPTAVVLFCVISDLRPPSPRCRHWLTASHVTDVHHSTWIFNFSGSYVVCRPPTKLSILLAVRKVYAPLVRLSLNESMTVNSSVSIADWNLNACSTLLWPADATVA